MLLGASLGLLLLVAPPHPGADDARLEALLASVHGRSLDARLTDFRKELDDKWRSFLQKNMATPFAGGAGNRPPETIGAAFLKSEQWKLFRSTAQKRSGTFSFEAKAVTPLVAPPAVRWARRAG